MPFLSLNQLRQSTEWKSLLTIETAVFFMNDYLQLTLSATDTDNNTGIRKKIKQQKAANLIISSGTAQH